MEILKSHWNQYFQNVHRYSITHNLKIDYEKQSIIFDVYLNKTKIMEVKIYIHLKENSEKMAK